MDTGTSYLGNGYIASYGVDDNGGGAVIPSSNPDEQMYNMGNISESKKAGDLIKSSVYNKDVKEVRPNNIALLACRKD